MTASVSFPSGPSGGGGHNPDILTCLANLSADEVFTPPKLANAMLDTLPQELFQNPTSTFLDPFTKSGVFLREIARRLNAGLADQMPDEQKRVNHILTKQVFGMGISELTWLIARRSLYCSKKADGRFSICTAFDRPEGNIIYPKTRHRWNNNGKCEDCGANKASYERGEESEAYAYPFIHGIDPQEEFNVKFDVIIGNPPYQLSDGGFGKSAAPIYHRFVTQAKKLQPRYLSMITPSRWFAGGKGLDQFRDEMLHDRRILKLVDYPKLFDVFPGVKIRGGVSYFLWKSEYDGPCLVQSMWDSKPQGKPVKRYLDAYDVFVRSNEAISILDKVCSYKEDGESQKFLDSIISSRKPFGFPTNYHGAAKPDRLTRPTKLFGSQKITWIERDEVRVHPEWIDKWKVLLTRLQGTSGAIETKFVSNPIIAKPGDVCSETYLVAGVFKTKKAAKHYADYLRTRFARFLVSLRKVTQDATKSVYGFVPLVPLDRTWTDDMLYERYGLNEREIEIIESTVRPMEGLP